MTKQFTPEVEREHESVNEWTPRASLHLAEKRRTPRWKNTLFAILQMIAVVLGFILVLTGGVYIANEATRWAEAHGYIGVAK